MNNSPKNERNNPSANILKWKLICQKIRLSRSNKFWNNKYLYGVITVLILFWGVMLRLPELLSGNYLFGYDQGWNYIYAREIIESNKIRLIGAEVSSGSGISGIFHGPFYYYLLALAYVLFNGNPIGGMWLMFICGIMTLVVIYLWSRLLFHKWTSTLILFLTAIGPQIVPESRFIWSPHPVPVIIVIILYLITKSLAKPGIFLPLAAFASGFIYNFHLGIAIPVIISIFVYAVLCLRVRLVIVLRMFVALVLSFLPMIIFEVRHGFMAFSNIIKYFTELNIVRVAGREYSFMDHLRDYWVNAVSVFQFGNWGNNFYFQIIFFVILAIGVIYYVSQDKTSKSLIIRYLISLIVITYSVFLVMNNNVWGYYLTPLLFAYIIIYAYLIEKILQDRQGKSVRLIGYIYIIIPIIVFINGAFRLTKDTYIKDYFDYGVTEKIKGKISAIDYIYRNSQNKPFTVLVFSPPVYTYPYDYLFLWYGKNKYDYVPDYKKSAKTYLLIQPDPEKPWSYKGWLETVIKDGKTINVTHLPSGFIIEERMFYEK